MGNTHPIFEVIFIFEIVFICRQHADCSHKYKIKQGVMVRGMQKTNFNGRCPLVEDNLRGKMAFGVEDNLQWKTSSEEDNLRWNMTFGGSWPKVEDDLRWKPTLV